MESYKKLSEIMSKIIFIVALIYKFVENYLIQNDNKKYPKFLSIFNK